MYQLKIFKYWYWIPSQLKHTKCIRICAHNNFCIALIESHWLIFLILERYHRYRLVPKWEGNHVATYVTPLITKYYLSCLTPKADVLLLPHSSMCAFPELGGLYLFRLKFIIRSTAFFLILFHFIKHLFDVYDVQALHGVLRKSVE